MEHTQGKTASTFDAITVKARDGVQHILLCNQPLYRCWRQPGVLGGKQLDQAARWICGRYCCRSLHPTLGFHGSLSQATSAASRGQNTLDTMCQQHAV